MPQTAKRHSAIIVVAVAILLGALAGSISAVATPARTRTVTVAETKTLVLTRSFDTRQSDRAAQDAFARSKGGVPLTIERFACKSFEGTDRLWNAVICVTPRRLQTSPTPTPTRPSSSGSATSAGG